MGKYQKVKGGRTKKVKETYMEKFRRIRGDCLLAIVAGLVLFLITLISVLTTSPVSSKELTPITGEFQYYREGGAKHRYIAIGLKGSDTEYHISSVSRRELDKSFFKDVKVGDRITIYIDKSADRELSDKGVDKKKWNYIYGLKIGQKVYFSYDDYLKAFNRNMNLAKGAMGFGIILIVSMPIVIAVSYNVCKKKDEKGRFQKIRKL